MAGARASIRPIPQVSRAFSGESNVRRRRQGTGPRPRDTEAQEVHIVSAGHPPALLRGANRQVRGLPSTGLLLGAVGHDEYEIDERQAELVPGDTVVAYTDGAYEARDRAGNRFGLERLRHLLRGPTPRGGWPQSVCGTVETYRGGRAEDDLLVASLDFAAYRPQLEPRKPALVA